jgi:prevent-host-death family protein
LANDRRIAAVLKVNMHEAKTQLSKLVEAVASGREDGVIIAKDGEPRVKIVPLTPRNSGNRIGIAKGLYVIPDNIDRENDAIAKLFDGEDA